MFFFVFFGAIGFAVASQKCYPPYGCFSDDPPFDDALVQLPENPTVLDTKFILHLKGKKNVDNLDPVQTNISSSKFDPALKTIFILHGYLGGPDEFWVDPLVDELLDNRELNVIVMDAKRGLQLPYHQAIGNARILGAQLARLVTKLKAAGSELKDMHCIGLGTGAHICGYMGSEVKNKTNEDFGRITGLDPSGPYFEYRSPARRLDKSDADFVDVIHTDSVLLLGIKAIGTIQQMGHIDFYPNSGSHQPGCLSLKNGPLQLVKCNHYRAVRYFTETINPKHCKSRAYACKSWEDFDKGLCRSCPKEGCPTMGYNAVEYQGKNTGKFYLKTESEKQFCTYHYNIEFHTQSQILAGLKASVSVILTGKNEVSETIKIPSHNYRSGSKDSFLIHTRKNLGELTDVKITHDAYIDQWKLYAVVIRPMWTSKAYTGCYQRWLNNAKNEVKLKTGQAAYCPE